MNCMHIHTVCIASIYRYQYGELWDIVTALKILFRRFCEKKVLYILLTARFGWLQGSLEKRRAPRQGGETGEHTSRCCSRPAPPGSESTRHRAGRPGTDAAGQKRARTPSLPGLVWQPPAAVVLSVLSNIFLAKSIPYIRLQDQLFENVLKQEIIFIYFTLSNNDNLKINTSKRWNKCNASEVLDPIKFFTRLVFELCGRFFS